MIILILGKCIVLGEEESNLFQKETFKEFIETAFEISDTNKCSFIHDHHRLKVSAKVFKKMYAQDFYYYYCYLVRDTTN